MIKFESQNLKILYLPKSEYSPILDKMESFTQKKIDNNINKINNIINNKIINNIWLLEHTPIYTQGKNGKPEHILRRNNIPIIQTSRGGQITYHGPGQLMVYFLLDLKSLKSKDMGPKKLINNIENIVISLLKKYKINSYSKTDAPGIYVNEQKICSIGLRIKQGQTYHGIALNVNMDLAPFNDINPCGYNKLTMCQISDFVPNITLDKVKENIMPLLIKDFNI